jgi:hypothetical protein
MARTRRTAAADADDVKTIRRLFFGGCFFLPWLWCVSCLHFRRRAARPDAPEELVLWYRRSRNGFAVALVAFAAWVLVFQLSWRKWGLASLLVVPAESLGGVDPW